MNWGSAILPSVSSQQGVQNDIRTNKNPTIVVTTAHIPVFVLTAILTAFVFNVKPAM